MRKIGLTVEDLEFSCKRGLKKFISARNKYS